MSHPRFPHRSSRAMFLAVFAFTWACSLALPAGAQESPDLRQGIYLGVDSRGFGTLRAGWTGSISDPGGWTTRVHAGLALPVLSTFQGGPDTFALDVGADWDVEPVPGLRASLGLSTGTDFQVQTLGTFLAFPLRARLALSMADAWGHLGVEAGWQGSLATLLWPSGTAADTWADRYGDASSQADLVVLAFPASRLFAGITASLALPGGSDRLWMDLDWLFPSDSGLVQPMDGFSFGELPFQATLGWMTGP